MPTVINNTTNAPSQFIFSKLLATLFIGLKLGEVINWSWWMVLSPMWIAFIIGAFMVLAEKAKEGKEKS